MHDDVLPDRKIQEIIYAAIPELRHGSRTLSVVETIGARASVTFQVVQQDERAGDERRAGRATWHRVRWGSAATHQATGGTRE
jgi:hypothetical protein